jgi:NTP pyrophosphatase (non-canonical NTP hydrolase)
MKPPYTFEDFLQFIDEHDVALRQKKSEQAQNPQFFVLARLAKLMEESGELADAILHYYGQQRQGKATKAQDSSIAEELADVYIVLTVIAKHFDLDVLKLLEAKDRKMTARRKEGDL